jgi:hypothetical protein
MRKKWISVFLTVMIISVPVTAFASESDSEELSEDQIRIDEDTVINVNDYTSVMGFADLAIKQGDDYLYDMDGSLLAETQRDITDIDWERIVLSEYEDFDVEAAKEDYTLLTELEPFVLKDSFIMQINAVTGEVSYIKEPTVSFAFAETEDEEEEDEEEEATDETVSETDAETDTEDAATEDEETEEDEDSEEDMGLMSWTIEDEDKQDNSIPNLVIQAEFSSMGPFIIFMPINAD